MWSLLLESEWTKGCRWRQHTTERLLSVRQLRWLEEGLALARQRQAPFLPPRIFPGGFRRRAGLARSLTDDVLQGSASPPARGSRWLTADLVQDAALDTNTVARMKTKLHSAARPRVRALHLDTRPLLPPRGVW